MKSAIVVVSLFVLASTLVAQDAGMTAHMQTSQTLALSADPTSSCPVTLHALQGTGGGLIAVHNAKPVAGPSQRIHLVLSDTPARALSAKVIVRGLSGKNQVMRTLPNDSGKFDSTKTLDIRFFSEDDKSVAADLTLPGFTSVQSIELQSIRYEDGSTWTFAGREACHVAPDPFMLVAGR